MARTIIAVVFLLSACAGSQPVDKPEAGSKADGMSKEEAHRVVAALTRDREGNGTQDVRPDPQSLDDVLGVLKTDQIDLFPQGVAFAQAQKSLEAQALSAQIELAWAEANVVLADILWEDAARLRPVVRGLEVQKATGAISAEEQNHLLEHRKAIREQSRTAEALIVLASEHAARGAKIARGVIDSNPDNYLGYRVAADYYRLRQDWANFKKMIEQIEATNPDSNGLLFLRGVAAVEFDDDLGQAIGHFRQALERDPKFTRAQAQLVLNQDSVRAQFDEYQILKKLNPRHQIVRWAGPAIERSYARWQKRRQMGNGNGVEKPAAPAPANGDGKGQTP